MGKGVGGRGGLFGFGFFQPGSFVWLGLHFGPCGGLTLAGCHVPTKAVLSLLHLTWIGERKYNERLVGRDKDRERSLSN